MALSSLLLGFCNRLPGVSAQTDKQAAGDPVPTRPGRAHGQGQGLGSHSPSAPRPSWDSFRPGTRAGQSSWPGAGCAFDPSSCEVAVCLGRTSQGPVSSLPLGHLFWGGREAGDETAGPETAALRRGRPPAVAPGRHVSVVLFHLLGLIWVGVFLVARVPWTSSCTGAMPTAGAGTKSPETQTLGLGLEVRKTLAHRGPLIRAGMWGRRQSPDCSSAS